MSRTTVTLIVAVAVLLVSVAANAAKGPSGTFRNESGQISLKYAGEGMVEVALRTKYCELSSDTAGTFVFPQGIHVLNAKGEPLLVIFYQPREVVVYAELPAFAKEHCKGGQDVTGLFKRVKK